MKLPGFRVWRACGSTRVTLTSAVAIVTSLPTVGWGQAVDRAAEIALRSLDAVENEWVLVRYDEVDRARASVNLRGVSGTVENLGLTANLVADRGDPGWRLDVGGDIGPLTMVVSSETAGLLVPGLQQHALARSESISTFSMAGSLTREVSLARGRLERNSAVLRYDGEEPIGGRPAHRLVEVLSPGVTTTYWVDATTYLPRRVRTDRPGRRDVTVDFEYESGPRPSRIEAYFEGERDVLTVTSPEYEESGRVSRFQVTVRVAGGDELTIDVTFDWSPAIPAGFFRFEPPPGSQEVPFDQLAQGVMFVAAGRLSSLIAVLMGVF